MLEIVIQGVLSSIRGCYFDNMKPPSHEWLMTFWSLISCSDYPADKILHQYYDLDTEIDFYRILSVFYGAFSTGVAC